MSNGYVRQSSAQIVTNNTIQASDFNNEYNVLQTAFDALVGHTHNGATGQGGPILASGILATTAGGTANALTATITGLSIVTGTMIVVFATATPTGAATIAVNGGSAINIQKITPAGLINNTAGDWVSGFPIILLYNGTVWIALNEIYEGILNAKSTSFTLAFTNWQQFIVCSAVLNITLPASNLQAPYLYSYIYASNGDVTLIPNGTDNIMGANSNFVIPSGTSVILYGDAAGNWYVNGTGAGVLPAKAGGTASAYFTVAGLSTARTLTFPDASDTVVTLTGTQALTNKTLTSPVLTTPTLGVATATTINKVTITTPASGSTLTLANGKTLSVNNTLTLAGTDSTTITFQGTDTYVGRTTSDTLSNKTLTTPTINGGTATALTGLAIRSSGTGAFDLTFANTENLTAGRTLTITLNDVARTINLSGNITTANAFITSGNNSLTLTTTGATNVTLPTSGTLVNSAVTSLGSLTTASSLVTVGTITSGIWNGTVITTTYGGTNVSSSGSSGNILQSNGTNWASVGFPGVKTVKVQTFTAGGTYTPSAGMLYCIAEGVGSGGSGAAPSSGAAAGGGGGGEYGRVTLTAAQIGVSQTVTIGAAATGGVANGHSGAAGNTTSLGTLLSCAGGSAGTQASTIGAGGLGGTGAGAGDLKVPGSAGGMGLNGSQSYGGFGGHSYFGAGAITTTAAGAGANGIGYGGGGAGAVGTGGAGGNSTAGYMIITEFCSQ